MREETTKKVGACPHELTLRYPVHTLNNRLLLPAGTVLSEEIMHSLAYSARKNAELKSCSLLSYGSTRKDILTFFETPHYHTIFNAADRVEGIMQVMEQVNLALPLLHSFDYFMKHGFYTYRHILMVFALAILLAKDLIPGYQDRVLEGATAPTHDFGKICVPLPILKKSSPLTKTEHDILKHHTLAGYVLLSYYLGDPMDLTVRVARDHHERRNGSGYPCGKLLNDFMVEIITVCDIYDALISSRPYRPVSFDNRTALEVITAMAERDEVSWEIVKALVSLNRTSTTTVQETTISLEKRGIHPAGNMYGKILDNGTDQS
jgi:HD-GYP domain-containing protein (c-di-GMP phosphodiesterase class II)